MAMTLDEALAQLGIPTLEGYRASQGLRMTLDDENAEQIAWQGDQRLRGEAGYDALRQSEDAWRTQYGIQPDNLWNQMYGYGSGPVAGQYANPAGGNWIGGTTGTVYAGDYPSVYGGATTQAITPQAWQQDQTYKDALAKFQAAHPGMFQLSPQHVKYDPATGQVQIQQMGQDGSYAGAYITDPSKIAYDPEFGLYAPGDVFAAQGTDAIGAWKSGLWAPFSVLAGGLGGWAGGAAGLGSAGTAAAAGAASGAVAGSKSGSWEDALLGAALGGLGGYATNVAGSLVNEYLPGVSEFLTPPTGSAPNTESWGVNFNPQPGDPGWSAGEWIYNGAEGSGEFGMGVPFSGGLAEDAGLSANDWMAQQVGQGGGDLSALLGSTSFGGVDTGFNQFSGGLAEDAGMSMNDWYAQQVAAGGGDLSSLMTPHGLSGLDVADATKKASEAAAATGAKTALGKLLGGEDLSGDDWAKLLGGLAGGLGALAPGILGAIGAKEQADAYRDVSDKYWSMGQPYRDRLNASYGPDFSMMNEPGYAGALDQTSKSVLRGLSTQGNPFDNPGVLSEANKYVMNTTALPQLNTYRSQLGTFGQLGVNTAGTADMSGAKAGGGIYDAIGYGLNNALNPQTDLTAALKRLGFGSNTGISNGTMF